MPTYSLTVDIDHTWVKQVSQQSAQICLAFETGIGGETFSNVVACTSEVAPHVRFIWQDDYMMAGSDDEFDHGAQFGASSDQIAVQKGSVTTLSPDWDISSTASDTAPRDGFIFKTERNAAAVLYRRVNGQFRAVYISNGGKLPANSQEMIVPRNNVAVWIASDVTSSTIIAHTETNHLQIDMGGKADGKAIFGPDGQWKSI